MPIRAKLGCVMVWLGSMLFYNCDVVTVKVISSVAAACGGFFVAITPKNAVYRPILIRIAVGGAILAFVILILRENFQA